MKALSEYQQAILGQLDIIQWRLREPVVNEAQTGSESVNASLVAQISSQIPVQPDAPSTPVEQPVQKVKLDPLFAQDVLLALEAYQPTSSKILNWQLGDTIQLNDAVLITPPPEKLCAQPQLKKQLWNTLQQWQK